MLLEYYVTDVAPILQYGALVYCCCCSSPLQPISLLQKIIKLIHFRKKATTGTTFAYSSILTVYELHIYELLKFVLKVVNSQHTQDFCNNLFFFKQSFVRVTRSSDLKLLEEPFCKRKIDKIPFGFEVLNFIKDWLKLELFHQTWICLLERNYPFLPPSKKPLFSQ